MPDYCTLDMFKRYLNISASSDEQLITEMLDAAAARIDTECSRSFFASADTTRYFDPSEDVVGNELWLDGYISYITSVENGDGTDVTSSMYTRPRRETPYYMLGFKTSMYNSWTYTDDQQNAIAVTGRWAHMIRAQITALSRTTNVVTATVAAPNLVVGAYVTVVGCSDTSFNGKFTVLSNSGSSVTWAQTAANDTDTTATMLYTPPDIVTACRRLAAWMYRQKDTQGGDLDRPLLAGDGSVIMPTTLPNDVAKILYPYQRRL